MGLLCAVVWQTSLCCKQADRGAAARVTSAVVPLNQGRAQGVDRNSRYEPGEEETKNTNPNRQCAPERLPRHKIAITDCEAGNESEIERLTDRPALKKANQQPRAT